MNSTLQVRPRVLVVEDDPDQAALARTAIRRTRHNVTTDLLDNGRDALAALVAPGAPPALTLMDFNLPLIDGLDVLRQVRAHEHKTQPVIVLLTTSSIAGDRALALAAGCNEFHVKPMGYADFAKLIEEIMARWLPVAAPS